MCINIQVICYRVCVSCTKQNTQCELLNLITKLNGEVHVKVFFIYTRDSSKLHYNVSIKIESNKKKQHQTSALVRNQHFR